LPKYTVSTFDAKRLNGAGNESFLLNHLYCNTALGSVHISLISSNLNSSELIQWRRMRREATRFAVAATSQTRQRDGLLRSDWLQPRQTRSLISALAQMPLISDETMLVEMRSDEMRWMIITLPLTYKRLASMERDDLPASSTASSTAAAMSGKVGSEFET